MTADRAALLQRKAELERRLEKIRADYAGGLDPDSEERASQLENADVLEELTRLAVEELDQIERQLRAHR